MISFIFPLIFIEVDRYLMIIEVNFLLSSHSSILIDYSIISYAHIEI